VTSRRRSSVEELFRIQRAQWRRVGKKCQSMWTRCSWKKEFKLTLDLRLFSARLRQSGFVIYWLKPCFANSTNRRIPLFLNGQTRPLFLFIFVLFSHRVDKYSTNLTIIEKSIDGMLGSWTRGSRMEGADESTELWRDPTLSQMKEENGLPSFG